MYFMTIIIKVLSVCKVLEFKKCMLRVTSNNSQCYGTEITNRGSYENK